MATKIDIGLHLTGQDAIDFCKYMENPTYTPAAIECMKEALAIKRARDAKKNG